jgi:hypothetical protein
MSNTIQNFIPLRALIDSLPGGAISPQGGSGFLDRVGITDFKIDEKTGFATTSLGLAFADELGFEIPGIDGLGIYLGSDGATNQISVEADISDGFVGYEIRIVNAGVIARFPPTIFRKVQWTGTQFETVKSATGQPLPYEIAIAGLTVSFDSDGDLTLSSGGSPPAITLAPMMVGDTGVVIEADSLEFYLSKKVQAPGQAACWRGVHIQNAKLHLPGSLAASVGILQIGDAYIGSGGFTGSVSSNWPNGLAINFFGVDFILKDVALGFVQNALVQSKIKGTATLPFFDHPLDLEIGIGLNGSLTVGLGSATGLASLSIPSSTNELLKLELDSLKFEVDAGVLTATMSGKLTPNLGTLKWPTIDIKDLKIDSKGNLKLPGGWLDLPDQYGFDFHGFKVDITKFGMGRNEDGKKWIGFSGAVKLVDGLPGGGSVDGLRITANPDWSDPKIGFNGIGVELDAKAFYFKGHVDYKELPGSGGSVIHRFDGDITLKLREPELEIDGTLVIGSVAATGTTPAYNFFAIYVSVDIPTGIPLGATDFAFFGFDGLLAIDMAPDKKPSEAWYAISPAPSWYKTPNVGVADLENKWTNELGSKAFGAGVTCGSYSDNGFVISAKVLFAIVFPGPIVLFEGMANLLKDRAKLSDGDPLFRTLAVLDGNADSLLVGLDAQYQYNKTTGRLIQLKGGAEAYYEFHNPNAWHINLGVKEPREQRIQARVASLFDANAYLMLNAHQLAMGAWVGYDHSWKFGPLSVTLQAWMESNAIVSYKPAHLCADLWVHGAVDLNAFGFGLGLTVDARIAAEVFDPYHLLGDFDVEFHLPWPFKKKHVGAHVKLEWGPELLPPAVPVALKDVAIEHFKTSTKWPLIGTTFGPDYADTDGFFQGATSPRDTDPPPSNSPIVPLDCRPSLSFARNVNDDAKVGIVVQPLNPASEQIGDPAKGEGPAKIRYGLKEVQLEKWNGTGWEEVAGKGGSNTALPKLFGSWAPANAIGANGASQNKLLIWSKSGFDHIRHTGTDWGDWFTGDHPDFPCLVVPSIERTCVDFEKFDVKAVFPSPLTHPNRSDVHFISQGVWEDTGGAGTAASQSFRVNALSDPVAGRLQALNAWGPITVNFDEPVSNLRVVALSAPVGRADFAGIGTPSPFGPASPSGTAPPAIDPSAPDQLTVTVLVQDQNGTQFGPFPLTNHIVDIAVSNIKTAIVTAEGPPVQGRDGTMFRESGLVYLVEVCAEFGPSGEATTGVLIDNVEITPNVFSENFDAVTAPALPTGWTTAATGSEAQWITSTTNPASPANDALALASKAVGNTELITPIINVPAGGGTLTFQSLFNLKSAPPRVGFDGMVLEISIAGSAYQDIEAVGGSFVAGGYNHVISSDFGSPIAGRMAWSGLSDWKMDAPAYLTTIVNLPPTANGQSIQLKWRLVTGEDPASKGSESDDSTTVDDTNPLAVMESIRAHNSNANDCWTLQGNVLEPYTQYRLRIVTTADMTGDYSAPPHTPLLQFAFFQTKGPPGLVTLDRPAGVAASAEFQTGLDDLSRYVGQTIPPTVPKTGEAPLLPRPVYRGYDVGVMFNEDYVDLMYRLAGRDLTLLLYDRNNQPVRDHSGRLVVLENPWGVDQQQNFNAQEAPWISWMNNSPCVKHIDLTTIPPDQTLHAAHEALILDPDTLYSARVVPLLLHEDFDRFPAATSISGGGSLGRWQAVDLVGTTPSAWSVDDVWMVQTSSVGTPASLGTTLVLGNRPGLSGDDLSQPLSWSDYRLSLHFNWSKNGTIGLAFRYNDPNKFYLFTINRSTGLHRLRLVNGGSTSLQSGHGTYALNQNYHLVVEAMGASLRIYLDDTLLFDVSDNTISAGGIALQCSGCKGAAFSDIQVHDFSNTAKSVYQFPFTSSLFVDFFHHLHSFEDECWLASSTLTDTDFADLHARSVTAQNSEIGDDEGRAFERLADNVLGTSANQCAERTEITRIEQAGVVGAIAFLLRTSEPIDWARISLSCAFAADTIPSPIAPGSVKLVAATLGAQDAKNENVTLLVREAANLTGYRIEKRDVPANPTNSSTATIWTPVYEFGTEGLFGPGTQVVVNSGNPDDATLALPRVVQRFRESSGVVGQLQFPANAIDLRVVDPAGEVVHARRFLGGTTSFSPVQFQLLRKADRAAFFILPAVSGTSFSPGTYQLAMSFRRDNTTIDAQSIILSAAGRHTPEVVVLDVPWATVPSTAAGIWDASPG